MPLNDAMVAQSALVLNGFADQVADAQMEQRGAPGTSNAFRPSTTRW
jgi:hypothetical protein